MGKFILPPAPLGMSGPVRAWSEPVVIPSYRPMAPDRNPMFLENRVYQGSSGKVYPVPFTDRIDEQRVDTSWEAVHLENEFLRVMVLPQIGGRIHVGLDKTNGYDFLYRQNVIKPALVGLAGPWVSGGVEFNWPQHHRPSTFMPTEVQLEEHPDGSRTAWFSEHDPMNRLKGMHGVCLHPGKALIELKVRLYNRTQTVQTFLWWANLATHVHERYQSFFPPDVHYVVDHAKRAISAFPLCRGSYYGIDYRRRATRGLEGDEVPRRFLPPGGYPANDLSWYANIPVPTSYMAAGSREDFLGGYDHAREAGIVMVANHHIAPGKKQWTWGNQEFGYAWDRNLTEEDGPYIELMSGVYADNQPDFSFLHPGETRAFSHYWYPIQKIGPPEKANARAAVSLRLRERSVRVGVAVSEAYDDATIRLEADERLLQTDQVRLAPDRPFVAEWQVPKGTRETQLCVTGSDACKRLLIRYHPQTRRQPSIPPPATEPDPPGKMGSADELYLTGLHLEQYRHATRRPESYWGEALRRDPGDSRCNNAMGLWHLRRGEFANAERHFRAAIASLTRRNPNPYDGEPFYNLGLALRYLDREQEAYDAFYKATWNYAWQSASFYALAELDCSAGRWETALDHLERALRTNADHLKARNLQAIVLRKLGREGKAHSLLAQTLALDPLDCWALYLSGRPRGDTQVRLDLSLDFARAGLWSEAASVLQEARAEPTSGTAPLIHYYLGYFVDRSGQAESARAHYRTAAAQVPDYCFPARLEELAILESARRGNPTDAKAPYYLGNLLYDRRRHDEALRLWEKSSQLDPTFATVWRNLGIGYFNVQRNPARARAAYERALRADRSDARVFYERDHLWKRLGEAPATRLAELKRHPELVRQRDDLSVELSALYNQTGAHEKARTLLGGRKFQPWEGGEGLALEQHVRTHLALGRAALATGDVAQARALLEEALACPENLGEARHPLASRNDVHYWLGTACAALGDRAAARRLWLAAEQFVGDFQGMSVRKFSEMTYYAALSMRRLGRKRKAQRLLHALRSYAIKLGKTAARIDYFATSLPMMLLFEDDLQKRQTTLATFLLAQAELGLGRRVRARRLLRRVLRLDPNHALAGELLSEIAATSPRAAGNRVRVIRRATTQPP
jgi:tetratricopeptide (TPR) repeat protein